MGYLEMDDANKYICNRSKFQQYCVAFFLSSFVFDNNSSVGNRLLGDNCNYKEEIILFPLILLI